MKANAKILIVDNDKTGRAALRRVLDSAGYATLVAQDSGEALRLAKEQAPDLVLLDVNLPDISGVEVCKRIKASPGLKNMFVVMLSGKTTKSDSQSQDLESDADGTITRPIGIRELLAQLQSLLRIQSAEAQLRKSESGLRGFYAAMTEMYALHELVYDAAGRAVDYRILDCNPAFEQITGIPCQGAIGALASELYGTGIAPYLEAYAPVAETGQPAQFETEFKPMEKFFHISVFSPEKGRFATITTDITSSVHTSTKAQELLNQSEQARRVLLSILEDRKQAEVSLRENQAHLDLALQSARMGVWHWNIPENRHYFDEQTCHLLGLDPATFTGTAKEFFASVHPDDREDVKAALARTETQDILYEPEYRSVWPDKSLHYISARGRLVRDGSGQPARINGLIWDTTERKQAELELARRAEELARLYRASSSLLSDSPFDMPALARTILKIVLDEFGQSNCSLFLIENNSNKLTRIAVVGPYTDQVAKVTFTLDGSGQVPIAIRTGNCINTRDVRTNPDYISAWDMARSELTIPLKVGNQVIGAIDVQSALAGFFSMNDERLMTVFAERAALALEHSRLYEQTEARVRQLAALRTVDMAISGSFDINLTMSILLDQVRVQLDVHAADILAYNPVTQTFQFSNGQGFRTHALQHTRLRLGEGFAGKAAMQRQLIKIPDLRAEPAVFEKSPLLQGENFVSYVGIPLVAKGQIKGVLEVFHREPFNLTPDQQAFLEILSGQAGIAMDNAELFDNLQSSIADLTLAYNDTLEGWASALELRDKETEGHTRRVTDLTIRLARAVGTDESEQVDIYRGALLHDIGKIGVPDNIVLKPGPLTDAEWAIMREHPLYAFNLLSPIGYLREALNIPYCHHEKWDGTGYPRGLKGQEIPLSARIFSVVDVWDALTSDRPYRKAWTHEKARLYIEEQAGRQFDPKVVDIFLREVLPQ